MYLKQGQNELYYEHTKKGNPRTLINATAEVCKFLNGTKSEPIVKWVIDLVGPYMPRGLVHNCPYRGLVNCYGLNLFGDKIYFFPDGFYTFFLRIYNQKDPNIISIKVECEVTGTGFGDTRF